MEADPIERPRYLVSGGSGDIGAAVCVALAARGFTPVVGYHRARARAEAVAQQTGGQVIALDLEDDASILSAAEALAAADAQAPLVGVVLAGSPALALVPFGKIAAEDMAQQWRVNVAGPQQLLAELVRRCFRKRKLGTVVGVLTQAMGSGASGIDGASSGMGAYVIAKHGMAGLLAVLQADHPWLRVRVVRPGYTETRMLEAFDERFLASQRERGAFQTPVQVASMIVEEALSS